MNKLLRSAALFLLLPVLKAFGGVAMASLLPKVLAMLISPQTKQTKRMSSAFWNHTAPQQREENSFCIWRLLAQLFALGVVLSGAIIALKRFHAHRIAHLKRRTAQIHDIHDIQNNDAPQNSPSVLQIEGQPRQIIITWNATPESQAAHGSTKVEIV